MGHIVNGHCYSTRKGDAQTEQFIYVDSTGISSHDQNIGGTVQYLELEKQFSISQDSYPNGHLKQSAILHFYWYVQFMYTKPKSHSQEMHTIKADTVQIILK